MYKEKKRSKFLGLPLSFTTYLIDEEQVTIRSGFLNVIEDDAMMYKREDFSVGNGGLLYRRYHASGAEADENPQFRPDKRIYFRCFRGGEKTSAYSPQLGY